MLLAVLGGVVIGAFGVGLAWATVKPPAYMVVEYEITDDAGFEEFINGDAKIVSVWPSPIEPISALCLPARRFPIFCH